MTGTDLLRIPWWERDFFDRKFVLTTNQSMNYPLHLQFLQRLRTLIFPFLALCPSPFVASSTNSMWP